ncbi:MAG: aldose epimerase family protein [Eubacteriales bacterium]|nr:aldose epimerase family protein [Eubacteriales bacterium]
MNYTKKIFGTLNNGTEVYLHTMSNPNICISISEYGACITHLVYNEVDVVSGFDTAKAYEGKVGSMGFTIGRYANRIANGTFELNGKAYTLAKNNGSNHLHGGPDNNLSKKIYNVVKKGNTLIFSTTSPDSEEGYPGNLRFEVHFTLEEPSTLSIEYFATSDQDTILNVTNHSYFNLNGHNDGSIKNHTLWLHANHTTEAGEGLIPTGKIVSVANTPFDFTKSKKIGDALQYTSSNAQLALAGGLDHNFVLDAKEGCALIATLIGDKTKICMNTYTTEPGVQVYTACTTNIPNGKENTHYTNYSLVCLETQHFPDSIHQKEFPSVVLKANDTFYSQTKFEFKKAEF